MTECCGPAQPCCGGTPPEYDYRPAPYVDGEVMTFGGAVPRLTTQLTSADRRGTMRVRVGVGRSDYRVKPGLYAIGDPDDTAPVLVTGNYKLTVDVVREQLASRSVWLLLVDSRGVNVWCAAGKGVFSTAEVVRAVRAAHLEQIVSHTRLLLPQLAATGVAGHEVRKQTGFSVAWGPVRASDIPAYLDSGTVTPEMRRVEFPLAERVKLTGVELSLLWRPRSLAAIAACLAVAAVATFLAPALVEPVLVLLACAVGAVFAGAFLTPAFLPWLPGRAFSLKGAVAGAVLLGLTVAAVAGSFGEVALAYWGAALAGTALASYVAMNFTGSSTYTSPSGVEWEMRRAIPAQVTAAVVGIAVFVVGLVVG